MLLEVKQTSKYMDGSGLAVAGGEGLPTYMPTHAPVSTVGCDYAYVAVNPLSHTHSTGHIIIDIMEAILLRRKTKGALK